MGETMQPVQPGAEPRQFPIVGLENGSLAVAVPVEVFDSVYARTQHALGSGVVHGYRNGNVLFEPDTGEQSGGDTTGGEDLSGMLRFAGNEMPLHIHTPLIDAVIETGERDGPGVNANLVGPTGTGKTTAAEYSANESGIHIRSASLHARKEVAELEGYRDLSGEVKRTALMDVLLHPEGGVYLLDEFDAASADVHVGLNNIIDGHLIELPDGRRIVRPARFTILACSNTVGLGATEEYVGRERQDAAVLNRYAYIPWPKDLNLRDRRFLNYLRDENRAETIGYPYDFSRDNGLYVPSGIELPYLAEGEVLEDKIDLQADRVPTVIEWMEEVERCEALIIESKIRGVSLSDRTIQMGIDLAQNERFPVGMRWLTEMLITKGVDQDVRDDLRINYPAPEL